MSVSDLAAEAPDAAHWAFGAGFRAPLGTDDPVPDDVDGGEVARLALLLGDDALVLGHQVSRWCSRAPDLETDVALANIALDLLGQARLLLARAAEADPGVVPDVPGSPAPPEDRLAYFRDAPAFASSALAARADRDFAECVVRLLVWSAQRLAVLEALRAHPDPVLAGVARLGVPELTYHRDWSARWVVTLGQGTAESRRRLEAALRALWPACSEQCERHPEAAASVEQVLDEVLDAAGVARPPVDVGAEVVDELPAVLEELQSVARAHPQGRW